MEKIFKLQSVSINNVNKMVAVRINFDADKADGKVGEQRFVWEYTKYSYPTMENGKGDDSKYGRLYIIERMKIDGFEVPQMTSKPKNIDYLHLDERYGVWCNCFKNRYIRGEIDNIPFVWNTNVYKQAVIVNEAGFNGMIKAKIDTNRIISRLKLAGYSSLEDLFKVVDGAVNGPSDDPFKNDIPKVPVNTNVVTPKTVETKASSVLSNEYIYISEPNEDLIIKAHINGISWRKMCDDKINEWFVGDSPIKLSNEIRAKIKACDFSTPNEITAYIKMHCVPNFDSRIYDLFWKTGLDYGVLEENNFDKNATISYLDNIIANNESNFVELDTSLFATIYGLLGLSIDKIADKLSIKPDIEGSEPFSCYDDDVV